jgi:hypothetical protein
MHLFKTEMLWRHPPRHPSRPPHGYRAFDARTKRYGHARRCDAASVAHTVTTANDAVDLQIADDPIDATTSAALDRAA